MLFTTLQLFIGGTRDFDMLDHVWLLGISIYRNMFTVCTHFEFPDDLIPDRGTPPPHPVGAPVGSSGLTPGGTPTPRVREAGKADRPAAAKLPPADTIFSLAEGCPESPVPPDCGFVMRTRRGACFLLSHFQRRHQGVRCTEAPYGRTDDRELGNGSPIVRELRRRRRRMQGYRTGAPNGRTYGRESPQIPLFPWFRKQLPTKTTVSAVGVATGKPTGAPGMASGKLETPGKTKPSSGKGKAYWLDPRRAAV